MILKSLLRRKTRTLLTVIGVAIGVAAIVALGAMADGFAEGYSAIGGGSGADLLVMQSDAVDVAFSAVDEQVGETLVGLSGVKEVDSMIYTFAATEGMPYFIVYGYDPGGFAVEHFKIVEGEPLSAKSSGHGGSPLIIGKTAADDLEKGVGDTFKLYETAFRIVGIYETGKPFEDSAAVILLENAQVLSKHPGQANAFLLKLKDGEDAEEMRDRIEQRFPDLTATLSADFTESQEMLSMVTGFTWAVSFLAVVIGGVGVMNTVLMSIFERTREFGTLRAIGWRPVRVLGLVLGESVILCGLGGVVGAALGVGVVELVKQAPMASMMFPSTFSLDLFAQGVGTALALGLVGGLYPSWRASRLLPAEAMRYDGSSGARASRLKIGGTALRNLFRQPTRTLLTLAGIGIAIMAMVSLGGLADGMVESMTAMATGGGIHLAGMEAGASADLSAVDQAIVRRIADVPGVESAEGFLTGYTAVGDLPFFVVFGYHPQGRAIRDFKIVEGGPLLANRQIILGRVAAENLKLHLGESMQLFDASFRIVGIYETGVPFQDGGGVVTLRDAQSLFGQPRKVSFLGIRLKDPNRADEVIAAIETRFPEVSISKASEFSEDVADLKYMKSSTWGIAFLALLVGGAGMMNTMVMSVFERTREIGVLRALGWRRSRILSMILRESVALSLLGGMVGVVLGVGVALLLNQSPVVSSFAKASFGFTLFIQVFFTALILGALGGAYPSWRASLLRPVEALRYE
ncbi:MAG: ABC transporter permease [Anaerolineae bacterium]|nr:ABC transporter permease [Anaerolineae bacterium]